MNKVFALKTMKVDKKNGEIVMVTRLRASPRHGGATLFHSYF